MGSTAYEFYKYENTMAISDIRTSLWSGFSIKSTSLKRDLWEAVLLLPFFLRAHPGCVSATSCSIPHQSAARPGSRWGCKMEWKDHVSESQTGPVSTPALLLTRSVRRVRSSPKCSKCQVFITCVAVAQISFVLTGCRTVLKVLGILKGTFQSTSYKMLSAWPSSLPHFKRKRNFSDQNNSGKPPRLSFLYNCFLCHGLGPFCALRLIAVHFSILQSTSTCAPCFILNIYLPKLSSPKRK